LLYPRLVQETGSTGDEPFEPWLARSWSFSDDGLRLEFRLRDAIWSDGAPVTCRDVRFTFDVQREEALAWPGVFLKERIVDVECPAENRAVFVFSEAYPDQILDANDNAVVPAAYADIPPEEWNATAWEDRLVSCGPFRLEEVRAGQEAVLARDEGWWAAAGVPADRVVLRVYPDDEAQARALLDGEVDVVFKLPPARAGEIAARDDLALHELPSLSYTYIAWNRLTPDAYTADRKARGCGEGCEESDEDIRRLQREFPHPILADRDVRRALSYGIDREDLIAGLWEGYARAGRTPIVSALWAHRPQAAPRFDLAEANRLLDDAGWAKRAEDGIRVRGIQRLSLEILANSGNRIRLDAVERAAASLRPAGVEIVVNPLPRRAFATRARDKQFDGVISGWWAGTRVQPQNMLHTRAAVNRGNNLASWSTSESDRLLDRAAAVADRPQAGELWGEWQELFAREQPLTILYEETRLLGMRARIQGPLPSYLNPFLGLRAWAPGEPQDR